MSRGQVWLLRAEVLQGISQGNSKNQTPQVKEIKKNPNLLVPGELKTFLVNSMINVFLESPGLPPAAGYLPSPLDSPAMAVGERLLPNAPQ